MQGVNQTLHRVGVVILNWNRARDTVECLNSISRQDYPELEIIMIDNGSAEEEIKIIGEAFPGLRIIRNRRNLGFVDGCNEGIRIALQKGCSYIMLVNNDVICEPQMLSHLLRAMQEDTKIGMIGPQIFYFSRDDLVWSAGGKVNLFTGSTRHIGLKRGRICSKVALDVDYLPGAVLLIRRELLQQIGAFSPIFSPGYYEEVDLARRAKKAGYRIVCIPWACAWHKVSSSLGGPSSTRIRYLMNRNCVLFLYRWGCLPWPFTLLIGLFKGALEVCYGILFYPDRPKAIFRGLLEGVRYAGMSGGWEHTTSTLRGR